jgi:uncharacterized Zn-binding protein involved in type VI secretion
MPACARASATDKVAVHHCGVTPKTNSGSGNVFINDKPSHRVGDSNTVHPGTKRGWFGSGCTPHSTTVVAGSPNVFVNNKPIARQGDKYGCGIAITSGSPTVFANG